MAGDKVILEGSKAICEAAIRAGCRFYAAYPIQPSTPLLEHMARRMPEVGGVCVNAESEIEGINMVWGASCAGARAMIATTGTAISLMQETFAELANSRLPCVVVHMARGQSEYHQAVRGGGHGDYHFIVLAPSTVQEAADFTALAFQLADKWRVPVMVQGDYVLGHTVEAVTLPEIDETTMPPKDDWALTGCEGREPHFITFTGGGENPGEGVLTYGEILEHAADKYPPIAEAETRYETGLLEDADFAVVAFGCAGRFVKYAAMQARKEGIKVGYIRPITLWPFPSAAIAEAAGRLKALAVFELNSGKMVEDVRLAVEGRVPVHFIGKISTDPSGFGVGPALTGSHILGKIREVNAKL